MRPEPEARKLARALLVRFVPPIAKERPPEHRDCMWCERTDAEAALDHDINRQIELFDRLTVGVTYCSVNATARQIIRMPQGER